MMKILLGILLLCSIHLASAQQETKVTQREIAGENDTQMLPDPNLEQGDNHVYTMVDVKPEFPGGQEMFFKYIAKNFVIPAESPSSVKVLVSFIVEKDGSLTNIKLLRDSGYGTGKEAVRVIKSSPKWKPGFQNGKAVRVEYSVPISVVNSK